MADRDGAQDLGSRSEKSPPAAAPRFSFYIAKLRQPLLECLCAGQLRGKGETVEATDPANVHWLLRLSECGCGK
jgi:hypothetical protein